MAFKHDAVVRRKDYFEIDPKQIVVVDGWNKRGDFGDIDQLKRSIVQMGVKRPLIVKKNSDDQIILIDGERRLKATLMAIEEGADIASVPCIVSDRQMSEVEAMFLHIVSNDGKPFEPVEEASAFKQLLDWGMTYAQIAERTGRSEVHVRNRVELVNASPEVKKAVAGKQISLKDAKQIIRSSAGSVAKQKRELTKTVATTAKKREEKPKCDLGKIIQILDVQLKRYDKRQKSQRPLAEQIVKILTEVVLQGIDES